MRPSSWFTLGSILAGVAVILGAFGAHFLKAKLDPAALLTFETGVRYQMFHGLALLATGFAATRWPGGWIHAAGWLFLAGVLLFSGSLYGITLAGLLWLGPVTPLGGFAMIAGWFCLAAAGLKVPQGGR